MTGRHTRRLVTGLAAAAALVVVGCGGASAAGGPAGDAASAADPRAGTTTGVPTAAGSEAAELAGPVSLEVTGGIAGVYAAIEVAPDGSVEVADRDGERPAEPLTEAELTALADGLARVDFDALPERSVDDNAADLFLYTIAYAGDQLVTDRTVALGPVDDVIGLLADELRERGLP